MSKQFSKLIFPGVVSVFSILAITFLAFSAFAPAGTHAVGSGLGVDISTPDTIQSGGYYILFEHNPSTTINLENADAHGFYGYNHDSLKVYTNSPSGYQLYISSDQEGNFASDGSGNASTASNAIPGNSLFKDGTLGNTEYIAPTTGAFTAPSTAVSSGGTVVGSTTTGLGQNSWGFSMSQNDLYSPVPLKDQEQVIKRTRLDNSARPASDVSVAQDIYYGARVNTTKASGSYSGNILYTAMSDADDTVGGIATISPTSTSIIAGGDQVTIRTSLFTNMEDLGPVKVYIGHYASVNDTPLAQDACTNVSASIDTSANNNLVITCNMPAKSPDTYDVLIVVDKFEKAYLISNGFTYAVDLPAFWNITYMQEMTPAICNSVHTPTNAIGSNAILIDKTAALAGNYDDVVSDGTSPKVAQHTLYDIRDNKPYTVRKLADGNCWMTDNLAFELQANQAYTGVDNATGQEISFNTGASCSSNSACVMNGNTAYNSTTGQWYYTWYAATAGSGVSSQTNTDAAYSICPKGWRLPANYPVAPTKSYGSITNAYGFTTNGANIAVNNAVALESSPINLARYGGYFGSDGGFKLDGTRGCIWSSTASSNATYAHEFLYDSAAPYTYPQDWSYKHRGFSVRCVAL